ncbi:hypothetical protein BBJ28_00016998 [Nothophytophthora sp. Chile5]|nr:hypothetical protein BBJ28_00016998 [Nothophytophthora sp. Chile5]
MIGRKQRKRVIYVDGIPIESTLLDAGESGLKGTEKSDPASLLFDKYDTDGSGDIDFEEFKVLLRDLGVSLLEPKARAYFKRCDRRRRGSISFEEFRLALYTCDPKNPGRTGGFAPGQSLAPKDLFEMFDHDEEGAIDRGTFMELLEFLGRKMPLDKMEALFATYEDPELEMMTYFQFKKAWLSIVDVQAELRQRGERFNKFLPPAMLAKKLAMLVSMEEKQEARTLLEASHTLSDEMVAAQRRELVKEARLLARVTLTEALDAAGQVYVFGKGAFQRFDGEPREPDFVEFMEFGLVRELWRQRVRPPVPSAPSTVSVVATSTPSEDEKKDSSGSEQEALQSTDQSTATSGLMTSGDRPSPSSTTLETAARAFADRQISKATAFLWGKRVSHVACGAAMAYALTDAGEVFCWGGNKRQWRYFYDEATYGNGEKPHDGHNPDAEEGTAILTGDRHQLLHRPLTTRSEMLKLFSLPSQVVESQETHAQLELRQKYAKVFEKPEPLVLTEEDKRRRLQLVGQYYDLLNPVAPSTTEKPIASPPLQELLDTVEPELNVDDLSLSLYIRGVELAKPTRMALLDTLGECLELELECVGVQFHEHMKQQDQVARRYRKERRERPLAALTLKTTARWFELRELREKMANAEHERLTKGEDEYDQMKRTIMRSTQKLKRRAREGRNAVVSGSSNNHSQLNMEREKALLYSGRLLMAGNSASGMEETSVKTVYLGMAVNYV